MTAGTEPSWSRARGGVSNTHTGRVVFALLGASLLAGAQPPEAIAWLAPLALVPWALASAHARRGEAFVTGCAMGTAYGCLLATWIPEALAALGSSWGSSLTGLLATAAWAKAWLFGGLGVVLCATARWSLPLRILAAAGAVFALEGIASSARLGVPWGLVGHSQLSALGVAQLAVAGGVPLVSALVVAASVAIAQAVQRPREGSKAALALAAAWAGLAGLGLPLAEAVRPEAANGPVHDLLLIQPDLPRGERWGDRLQPLNLERVASYVASVDLGEPTPAAIVLPENLLTTPVDTSPALHAALLRWVDDLGIPVISGLALAPEKKSARLYRSSVVWLEPGRGITDRIDKVRAVPVVESGETLPAASLLARLYGRASDWKKVEEAAHAGPLRGAFTVTPVLCYEALFPGLTARRRTPDSVAILNLADDGWVVGDAATRQLTAFASFRAIEQRLTFLRVAHGGLSVVVGPFGRTLQALPMDAYASARVRVRALPPPALEEKVALLALPLAAGSVVWWGVGIAMKRRERR